jgi:hypothetical protein
MRGMLKLGVTESYELEPAFLYGARAGGYRNGPMPNYVYRWTEREFEKVINSFAPTHQHTFFYDYGYSAPAMRFAMARSAVIRGFGKVLAMTATLAERLLPTQGNLLAFGVLKNRRLQPWLLEDGTSLKFDPAYMETRYDKGRLVPARTLKR